MIDIAVVGSGHNALVAAAYLARAGRAVEVFERDTVLGGAVSTVPRFPGYLVDRGSSAHLMIRHTGIVEELELDRFGLRYLDCDPWAFAPAAADRPPLVFRRDLDATCASVAASCGSADAKAYRRFVAEWTPRSAAVLRMFAGPPTPRRFLRSFWGLRGPTRAGEVSRQFLTSGDALLDEYFHDERLKAALAWFGAQSGPPMSEPGTAPMVGFAALMHTLPPGRPVGGSGALTEALAARLRADGATIRPGDAVTAVAAAGRDWLVRTASGREVRARRVVAGCHVVTTLDLLQRGGFDPAAIASWRARIRVGPGIGMAVRLGTRALPRYAGVDDAADSSHGLQLLVSDRAVLRRAHGAALAGELPPRPAVLAMSFSALDPSLAPAGHHQVTLWSQWHPYRLADGRDWAALAEPETDRIIAEVDALAPGFADTIVHRHPQTPRDLAEELGLIGGNVMHVEMSLDQMLMLRPLPELAGYRVPGTRGLYLTGASTHPGGGVSGASGATVARLILRRTPG
jgi:phytoene dehydrogenase-like protein